MNFGTIQGPTYVENVQEMYRNYIGSTGGTTRTALAKFSLLTQWLGTSYDDSFCIIYTSLERPFQTEPWIFLLYTIATSYVVEKQLVFQFYRIIDFGIFIHWKNSIAKRILLHIQVCYYVGSVQKLLRDPRIRLQDPPNQKTYYRLCGW